MCYIADGRTGACDRYGNVGGRIVRLDPLTILDHAAETGGAVVPFVAEGEAWDSWEHYRRKETRSSFSAVKGVWARPPVRLQWQQPARLLAEGRSSSPPT